MWQRLADIDPIKLKLQASQAINTIYALCSTESKENFDFKFIASLNELGRVEPSTKNVLAVVIPTEQSYQYIVIQQGQAPRFSDENLGQDPQVKIFLAKFQPVVAATTTKSTVGGDLYSAMPVRGNEVRIDSSYGDSSARQVLDPTALNGSHHGVYGSIADATLIRQQAQNGYGPVPPRGDQLGASQEGGTKTNPHPGDPSESAPPVVKKPPSPRNPTHYTGLWPPVQQRAALPSFQSAPAPATTENGYSAIPPRRPQGFTSTSAQTSRVAASAPVRAAPTSAATNGDSLYTGIPTNRSPANGSSSPGNNSTAFMPPPRDRAATQGLSVNSQVKGYFEFAKDNPKEKEWIEKEIKRLGDLVNSKKIAPKRKLKDTYKLNLLNNISKAINYAKTSGIPERAINKFLGDASDDFTALEKYNSSSKLVKRIQNNQPQTPVPPLTR